MKVKSNFNSRAPATRAATKARELESTAARWAANGKEHVCMEGPRYRKRHAAEAVAVHPKEMRQASDRTPSTYARLFHDAPVGYATLDSSGVIRQINRAGARMLGRPVGRLAGQSFSAFLARQKDRRLFSQHLQRSGATEETEEVVTTELHLARDRKGRCREVQLTTRRGTMAEGCLLMVITDISSLRRAHAELGADNERLEERAIEGTAQLATTNQKLQRELKQRQRMEKEMTEISEQERRSLGQELHDGICQHLTGVAMMADTLSDACQQKSLPEVSVKVKALADLIRTAANDTRNVARGLHPVEMDASGLVSALYDLTARHKAGGHIRCQLQCSDAVEIQDNEVAMQLYRIAQQALANASRHDDAHNIVIKLGIQKKAIVLAITDDGAGVPSDVDNPEASGLSMMRHRASVIGARLEFRTTDTGGNVVRCTLPVPAFTA
jgi:PAS domain S-box-containing protein